MKGIYLTEESKQEIEAKIEELNKVWEDEDFNNRCLGKIQLFQEILESATILPVYSDWDDVDYFPPDNESQTEKTLKLKQGVIIQPKQ